MFSLRSFCRCSQLCIELHRIVSHRIAEPSCIYNILLPLKSLSKILWEIPPTRSLLPSVYKPYCRTFPPLHNFISHSLFLSLPCISLFLSLSLSILIAVIFLLSVRVPPLSNANLLSILRPPPVNSSFSLFYSLFPSPIPLTFLSSFFSPSLPSLYRHSRVPHDWSEAVHRQSSSRSSRCVRQSRYCSVHYLVIHPNTHLTRRRTIHSSSLNIVQ